MKRLSLKKLEKWKASKTRRPLLMRGARQVGKTWLVREHGRSYEQFVEINLEKEPQYLPLFKSYYGNPKKLLLEISLLSGKKIEAGKTLFFIDEIQASREALLSLRYFKEELSSQHVIAAGSLLEFTFSDLSFPVGRIEFFHLFPLNFEEFLLAFHRDDLVELIKNHSVAEPLSESLHNLMMDYFSQYALLGGLPEVVDAYISTNDIHQCQNIQQILVSNYREDFHKYSSKFQIDDVRLVFQSIPRLLGKKFKYSGIDPQLKVRELSKALNLLEQAGLAYKVCHSASNGVPLDSQSDPKKFKVFFVDTGLCHRILGLELSKLYLERKELMIHRGGVAEQVIAQELLSYTPLNESPLLHYWHREAHSASAEVDFVISSQGRVLPIEVKAERARSSKSLGLFLEEKKKSAKEGSIFSSENFFQNKSISHYPLYAVMRLMRGDCEDF